MFGRSTGSYDRLLEKATSQLLLEPDWDSILQICDAIRQADVAPKYVVSSIKKKASSENPHVCMFALQVLESVVKNCGSTVHAEVATKEFMEFMKDQAKVRTDPVKPKILELIQVWSNAFRNEPSYKAVQDTYHLMKMEGYSFPAMKEADAMFLAEKAPEWKDGEVCHRCRVQFSMVQRKHHCRHCGQIFCSKCSSKSSIIPRFGIEREVRVCEACFDNLNKPTGKKEGEDDLPAEYLSSTLAQQPQVPPQKSEAEIQEEEELMLALALSKSEAENKEKEKSRLLTLYGGSNENSGSTTGSTMSNGHSEPPAPSSDAPTLISAPVLDTSDMDPELARYLNRNYWEQKQEVKHDVTSTTQPSAPSASADVKTTTSSASNVKVQEKFQNGEVNDEQQFLNALQSSLEIFVNRMKSNSQRGRSIANDSSVQSLFMTINAMHPQLIKHMAEQEDARNHYESLQDKLAQMKDAREALDALRDEHREKRRREMEELERQRQIQMAAKLEIMRQKKQEYLDYQRQIAIQRMQEQEREMQMRFEQQKQMQHMRAMQTYYPQMYVQQPGYSPSGSVEGSPHHQPHMGGPPPPQGPPPQYSVGGPGQPPMGAPMGPPGSMPPPGHMGGPAPPPNAQPGPVPPGAHPGQPGPPPPGQPGYAPGQPGFQQGPPPGGFQPPPPMGYQPQGGPPGQHMTPPPAPIPNQQNYNAYNMQGVANNLPGQGPGGPQYQQQAPPPGAHPPPPPQVAHPPPPQGYVDPQQQGMPPPGVHNMQQHPQQQQLPPDQQGAHPQGPIAQLISFD